MPVKKNPTVTVKSVDSNIEAYCVRCKSKNTMVNGENKQTSNGRWMCQGACDKCGGKMNKFISTPQ